MLFPSNLSAFGQGSAITSSVPSVVQSEPNGEALLTLPLERWSLRVGTVDAQAPSEPQGTFLPGPMIGDAPRSWAGQKMVFGGKWASFTASGRRPKSQCVTLCGDNSFCVLVCITFSVWKKNKPSAPMVTWNTPGDLGSRLTHPRSAMHLHGTAVGKRRADTRAWLWAGLGFHLLTHLLCNL